MGPSASKAAAAAKWGCGKPCATWIGRTEEVIVVDASILADVIGDDGTAGRTARDAILSDPDVAVPDLADIETESVLRRRWLAGDIDDRRFAEGH